MDGERFHESIWWKKLTKRFLDVLERASAERLLVLVPQSSSLSSTVVTVADVGAFRLPGTRRISVLAGRSTLKLLVPPITTSLQGCYFSRSARCAPRTPQITTCFDRPQAGISSRLAVVRCILQALKSLLPTDFLDSWSRSCF
jgi:hypothetical protein